MSTIIRTRKARGFAVIDNRPINDKALSWEALGLLAFLLSKPDDWTIIVPHLVSQKRGAGRDKIYKMLAELETAGYLARVRRRQPDGTFLWERIVYEAPEFNPNFSDSPLTDFQEVDTPKSGDSPLPDLPYTAQPYTVEPTLLNTDLQRIERTSTEKSKGEEPPAIEAQEDPLPPLLEVLEKEAMVEALAVTCGLAYSSLRVAKGKARAKLRELEEYAEALLSFMIPADWCEEPEQAGLLTPEHVLRFKDYWQRTRPIGNSPDDLPHPVQVFHRLPTPAAIAWITEEMKTEEDVLAFLAESYSPPPPRPDDETGNESPAGDQAANDLWTDVLTELSTSLQRAVYDNWLRRSRAVSLVGDVLTVSLHDKQALEWVSVRMDEMIKARASRIAEREISLVYQVQA